MFLFRLALAIASSLTLANITAAQIVGPEQSPQVTSQIQTISKELTRISRSVDGLSKNGKEFFDAFSTNQGLQLTPRQQRILLAFEILNRSEARLANLQKMRMDANEKLASLRVQLTRIDLELLPENIDRHIVGTTNAEQLRDIRRQSLD